MFKYSPCENKSHIRSRLFSGQPGVRRPLGQGGRKTGKYSTDRSETDGGRVLEGRSSSDFRSIMKLGIDIGYLFGLIINQRIIKITSPFFITLLLLLLFFGSIGCASAALSGSVIAPASVNVCESTGYVI
ncbi:MAG: hypothetical protein WBK88_05815, partial [Methanothrix sp.]